MRYGAGSAARVLLSPALLFFFFFLAAPNFSLHTLSGGARSELSNSLFLRPVSLENIPKTCDYRRQLIPGRAGNVCVLAFRITPVSVRVTVQARREKQTDPLGRPLLIILLTLVIVQQHALAFLRVHRTVVQLVFLEKDLDESRPHGNIALDQRLRQRIFDVLLQGTPQRSRAVAAIAECLTEDLLLGLVGYGHGD